ncbi:MAG: PilZ domain-containing protein [Planctomycetota bacterium]
MDQMRYVEPRHRDEILAEAVENATLVVIVARRGRDWVTHKSQFLASPAFDPHLLIASPLNTEPGMVTMLTRGEQIGVSFRRGHKKCVFGTVVEDLQECPPAIVIHRPEQVQELQRRVYYRSPPPRGTTIAVRYWAAHDLPPSGLTDPPDHAYHATLKDLSAGGISIETCANPPLRTGQTVVCHFAYKRGAPPLTLDAMLRRRQSAPRGAESLGLQFVGLEATPGGRKHLVRLAKIVAEFQRCNYDPADRPRRSPFVPSPPTRT